MKVYEHAKYTERVYELTVQNVAVLLLLNVIAKKIITTHEIVHPPIARHKKIFLTFITFIFVKLFRLDLDKFPQNWQFIGFPVTNSCHSLYIPTAYLSTSNASF